LIPGINHLKSVGSRAILRKGPSMREFPNVGDMSPTESPMRRSILAGSHSLSNVNDGFLPAVKNAVQSPLSH
jgi:hypothetical protein